MSKRTLTAEQKAKSEARKARFQEIVKQVAAMDDTAREILAAEIMVTTCEGRTLSGNNQCLIAVQCQNATIVGGFRQWIEQGRCVRKGEHGLMIWIPVARKAKEDGAPSETGFIMGTVFDISQTEEIPAAVAA
jgi:hypothetical protein